MTVKNRIHRLLHDRGIRESDFVRQLGMEQGHFNRIKNGRVSPRIESALKIARGLGLSVDEVFYLDDRQPEVASG